MSVTIYTPLLTPLLDALSQPVRIPKFTYTGQAMSERKITATITSPTTLALVSGCYITFRGETFRLYETPAAKKTAASTTSQSAFEYTLVFYSAQHELATTDFIDIVSDTSHTYFNGGPVVDFVGTVPMLVERLQANLDRIYTGLNAWTIYVHSSVDPLESAQISLTDSTVWDALMLVNTTANWGYKFTVRGREITIGIGGYAQNSFTFEYGKNRGLYEISRTNIDSTKLITRLRAYGGSQNIPADYKKDGSGYVAPTYQYVKELSIPAYCYVSGATINAVGRGNWSSSTQYAIGDLVRYDKKRFYARAVPTIGAQPPVLTSEWSSTRTYIQGEIVTYGSLIYTCLNDSVGGVAPDLDTVNWEVNDWASWNEGYIQLPEATNENWKGDWQTYTQYHTGDIVSWDGLIYEVLDQLPAPNAWPPSSVPFDLTVQYTDGDRVRYNNRIWEFVSEQLSVVGEFPTEATWNINEEWGIWDRTYEELGIREGILRDDSIYPTLKGMEYGGLAADDILAVSPVTSAEQVHFKVWIRDIGFDMNDYLTTETPTFTVTRGAMAGCDFEIAKVEPSTLAFSVGTAAYVLTLVRNSQDIFVVPDIENSIYQTVETISAVDYLVPVGSASEDYAKFLLTGISMPNLYVRAAEERLLTRAVAYLNKYSVQQVTYAVGVDEIAAVRNPLAFDSMMEGDYAGVIDLDMNIHGTAETDPLYIPVQTLTITVGDGMIAKYDMVLSDEPVAGTLDAIKSDIKEQGRLVELTGRKSDRDIRAEALTSLYLKAALAGDTEIDGGLLMTNLLLLRDTFGNVNGGISGIQSDPTGIWTGGTYEDAVASLSRVLFRKDGSGQLAGGDILWDINGNATIRGLIRTSESGARVEIDPIRKSVITYGPTGLAVSKMSNEEVASIAQIELSANGSKAHSQTFYNTINQTNIGQETLEVGIFPFTLPANRYYNVTLPTINRILFANSGAASGHTSTAKATISLVHVASEAVVYTREIGLVTSTSNTDITSDLNFVFDPIPNIAGGDYIIAVTLVCTNTNPSVSAYSSATVSVPLGNTAIWEGSAKFTEIGSNGANMVTSATDYLHKSDGLAQIRNGNYIFRVSSAGIQKSVNGGVNWTNIET